LIRFLIDAQLPPRLARVLIEAGYQAEHVEDAGLRHAKDAAIWEYATRQQAVLVTKDEDFVERWRGQAEGPAIVWLRIGNAADAVLLTWLLPILPAVVVRLQSGDRIIEVR
jgi:predicted nuclease of predicted toxin-antitoxin system